MGDLWGLPRGSDETRLGRGKKYRMQGDLQEGWGLRGAISRAQGPRGESWLKGKMSPHFRCDKSEIILQLPHGGVWAGKQIRWSSEEQCEWAGFGYVPQREKWVMERKENAQRRVQSEGRVTGNTCSEG